MTFPTALEWIIFTKGMRGEFFRHDESSQVGMTGEVNTKEVPHFTLKPVRRFP
jgi:hypothetical protein